jgi:hypothetical protein
MNELGCDTKKMISLGNVFKVIRTEVFCMSLLDFGEMIGFSGSAWHRYENDNFGKTFAKNKINKLKCFSDIIVNSMFNYDIKKFKNKISYKMKLKNTLLNLYKKSSYFEESVFELLSCYPTDTIEEINEFINIVLLAFENETEYIDTEFIKRRNDIINLISKNRKEIFEKETRLKRFSLGLSICDEDESTFDFIHHYKKIKRIDFLNTKDGSYYTYRWIRIENTTNFSSDYVIHKEYGENKVHFKSMNIFAYSGGHKLKVENIFEFQPSFIQVFKIYFPKPLEPNEKIDIFYNFIWPDEVSNCSCKDLNVSISLLRYKKGVSSLEFGIFENRALSNIFIEKISWDYSVDILDNVLKESKIDNININGVDLLQQQSHNNLYLHYIKLKNPIELGYRLHYIIKNT